MNQDFGLFNEVFNQRAAILTFFGALGGSVRAAVLKTTWRESIRVIFVGGAVAFGVGILGPVVMKPWIGDLPDEMAGALGTLTAVSFLLGLVAVTLVERFILGQSLKPVSPTVHRYGPEGQIEDKPESEEDDLVPEANQ